MQRIWIGFLPTLTFVALVSAVETELENTDNHGWHWSIKGPTGALGVSLKINLQHDVLYYDNLDH